MSDDQIFRIVLIVGLGVIFPIGIYHCLKSQATGERLDRRQEGLFILATLRPLGLIGFAGLIAYLVDPAWMEWSQVDLPTSVRWLGVGIGVCAGALLVWVFRSLGTNITDTVVTRAQHELVTTGPYRWVRHPFYLAFALTVLANSLVTANWFLALTGVLAFGLIIRRTSIEEEKLIERFGDAYRAYRERTGKYLPHARVGS